MGQNIERQLNWHKSPLDLNDWKLNRFIKLGAGNTLEEILKMHWLFGKQSLDQLKSEHCVGFTIADFLINLPIFRDLMDEDAHRFYYMCKELEGEPLGEGGAYLRSAAQVLLNLKKIEGYAFATDINSIKYWLINKGPLMVGTVWLQGMQTPDYDNVIHAVGNTVGGHAYVINEWTEENYIGIQNSWGADWGENGKAYISQADFEKLFTFYGEAVTTVELDDAVIPTPPPVPNPPEEEPSVIIEPPIVVPPQTNTGCMLSLNKLFNITSIKDEWVKIGNMFDQCEEDSPDD